MIPKNLGQDPDFKRFQGELQETEIGLRWRKAWMDMHRALKLIKTPTFYGDGTSLTVQRIEQQRREYIKAGERASDALGEMTQQYDWPAEAQAASTFTWLPSARFARPRRT